MVNESVVRVSAPLGSDEELEARVALTGPGDVVRGLFFNSLLDRLRQEGDEALVRQCISLGGEARYLEFFNYPMATFLRMLYPAAWRLAVRHGDFEQALRQVGHDAARLFYASSAGKVMLLLARNEPLRLLNNLPSSTHAVLGDHTGLAEMKRTGQSHALLTYARDLMPRPYNEGALRASIEAVGARDVGVRAHPTGDLNTEYELTWT